MGTAPQRPSAPGGQLAPGWTEHTAPDGRKYFFNKSSGKSVWEKPLAEPAAAPAPKASPFVPALLSFCPEKTRCELGGKQAFIVDSISSLAQMPGLTKICEGFLRKSGSHVYCKMHILTLILKDAAPG